MTSIGLFTLTALVVGCGLLFSGASASPPSERALRDEVEWLSAELEREKLKGPYEEGRVDVVAALTAHNQALAGRVRSVRVRCEALRARKRNLPEQARLARGELTLTRAEIARRQRSARPLAYRLMHDFLNAERWWLND